MKNGTAIFLIFLFTAPAGAIAQTSQQTLENWQHRTDSLITITERIDPVADSAYFGTLLDSLYWTIHVVDQWKEFKEWDKVCPVLFKQLTLTEKRFGIYHPHYQSAANDFFNGILKSREGPLSDFFRPTINVCINPAGNLRMPADSVRLTEIVNNICIISDILLNKGYNLVEDVPALKDEDVRTWKDLPFTDIAFPLLQAQQFAAKNIGVNSRAYTKTLQLLSVFAVKKKEPARARAYLVEMQAIEEKRVSKNHPDYYLALVYWGKYYQATARYDSAEAILTEAIQKCRAFPPETTWRIYSDALETLMEVYQSNGRYYDMAPLVDERYELAVKYDLQGLLAGDFVGISKYTYWQDYASAFHQLGRSFAYEVYDYPKAIEYYQKASKVVAQYCKAESAALSWQISNGTNLGWAYMLSDRNDLADPLFEAAIQAGKKLGDVYNAQKEAAQYYMETNRPRRTEACFREIAAIAEKRNGRESWAYLQILKQLAWMYVDDGQFHRADSFLQEAKSIVYRAAGKENAAYCQTLNQLGTLHRITGNYSQSEACLLEAKGLIEKMIEERPPCGNCLILGDIKQDKAQHDDYSDCLIQLGLVYTELGQFARADNLLQTALGIYQEIQQKNPNFSQDRLIASLLNSIGFNYWDWGKAEEAERCFKESLSLWEKIVGKKKADYILPLHSLADWYFTEGRYTEAEPLYQEVSAFWAESGNKTQQQFLGMAQHYQAMLFENTGRPVQAEPLYRKAEATFIASIGAENRYYTACSFSLGQFYARRGRYAEAMVQLRRSNALEQQLLRRGSAHLSEGELQKLATRLQRSADLLASLALAQPGKNVDLPSLLYDNTLFYKGFLLESRLRLECTMRQADSVSARQYEVWKTVQRQLSLEFAKPIAAREDVVLLEERANTLEKELARLVAAFAADTKGVQWQQVRDKLQPGEAALEFVQYQDVFPKNTDSTLYAALVLRPGDVQPHFIPLFEEKSLDSLLKTQGERKADYVNGLFSLAERGARPLGKPKKTLYDLIWKPLEKALAEVKTIYFSPSGLLHRLNLAAIPINRDSVLGDQYNLVELGSTRQLVIPATVKSAANDAVLFGDIAYDSDDSAIITPGANSSTRGELSFAYTDSTLRVGTWSDLYYTGKEVESLGSILKSGGIQPQTHRGYAATEETFKSIGAGGKTSPRVLHIATHGYFFPDPTTTSARFQTSPTFDEPVFKLSDHPMIRSGLILAGGNHAWATGKPIRDGMEDGILTAYEISQMNLSNTELVVLSACETGLGDIQGNEGVYGLQRAFKIAGAKYLIMSLWQVPDEKTEVLMTTFYKKWLEEKMPIPEAFRSTQREMRERFIDPFSWAGFVLVE